MEIGKVSGISVVVSPEDFKELQKQKIIQENEILKELQDRINEAIEYIEWNLDKNEEVIEYINFDGNFNKVLDILKGENDK